LGLQRSVDLYNHSLFQTFFVWLNMCACIRKKVKRFVNFIFTIYQGVKERKSLKPTPNKAARRMQLG